ncbi:hypothetical protein JCM10207_005491 [Rhodosporidiobolus poonsookiae]
MDKLPDEILIRIIDRLEEDRSCVRVRDRRSPAQQALAAFARTSKRFHQLASRALYGRPYLSSARQTKKWLKTYSQLVHPFMLSRKATRRPVVLKPSTLAIHLRSECLPLYPPTFDHLNLFSSLTSLSLQCLFLKSTATTWSYDNLPSMEVVLNFIFEALVLSPNTQGSWSPAVLGVRNAIALGLAAEGEVDSDDDDEEFGEIAFDEAYRSCINPTSEETVALILNTSSFPSLSHLELASPDACVFYEPLSTVMAMRFAITNSMPDSSHGKLLSPLEWTEEQHNHFNALFNLDVAPFEPWPPLSPAEQQSYHDLPYGGPRLEELDVRYFNFEMHV